MGHGQPGFIFFETWHLPNSIPTETELQCLNHIHRKVKDTETSRDSWGEPNFLNLTFKLESSETETHTLGFLGEATKHHSV